MAPLRAPPPRAPICAPATTSGDTEAEGTEPEGEGEGTEPEGTTAEGGGETGGPVTTGAVEGDEEDTGSVNVLSALEPEEAVVLNNIIDELIEPNVDYTVEVEASADFEEQLQIRAEGGTLDIILLPQPGAVAAQAATGNAVSFQDMGFDLAQIEETFGEYLTGLGAYEGENYGIPTNVNLKSMVWYPKDDFDAAGYEVPETWDDLIALSDQIVADGGTPWCVGFEGGGATGWPATDWMEDLMLATAGQDTYTEWITHGIPFTDPAVVNAGMFGEVMSAMGTCSAVPSRRRRSPSVTHRRPCSRIRPDAGCIDKPASSPPSSRKTPRPVWTTTGSRSHG